MHASVVQDNLALLACHTWHQSANAYDLATQQQRVAVSVLAKPMHDTARTHYKPKQTKQTDWFVCAEYAATMALKTKLHTQHQQDAACHHGAIDDLNVVTTYRWVQSEKPKNQHQYQATVQALEYQLIFALVERAASNAICPINQPKQPRYACDQQEKTRM